MRVLHLSIQRFRGIRELDWAVNERFVCLIGPGDSTKSTILDAIDFALSPRWKIDFDDSDFYNADTTQDIVITATVGMLPDVFKGDGKFGLLLRGWGSESKIHDEPDDADELVISVELRVDCSLEPRWTVVNDRSEGRSISTLERELIGVARIGDFPDRHLTWTRGSILARMTEKGANLAPILAEAGRAARLVFKSDSAPTLQTAATRAQTLALGVGVAPHTAYTPDIDIQSIDVRSGGLSLHDGAIPVRRAGLGTRRLLTMALQRELMKAGGIALIDEVEHGLEPHRLRRLLRSLRGESGSEHPSDAEDGQVLMTTHSAVVVEELGSTSMQIVRSNGGRTQVLPIPGDLLRYLRKAPEAALGAALIVCEGVTEIGFCHALDKWWSSDSMYENFAIRGIVPVNGQGVDAPRHASALLRLGYRTSYFGDSDCALTPSEAELRNQGICVVLWGGNVAIEQRIALDLPWKGVLALLELASATLGEDRVRGAVISNLGSADGLRNEFSTWCECQKYREAIGKAAKHSGWFKSAELGERLGDEAVTHLPAIPTTDLAVKISALKSWIGADESV